jgi:hypothetical protein
LHFSEAGSQATECRKSRSPSASSGQAFDSGRRGDYAPLRMTGLFFEMNFGLRTVVFCQQYYFLKE